MKSISLSLPGHYYSFYEYLKNSQYISTEKSSFGEIQKKIKEREKILLQIEYFKNEHDPLASSSLAQDIKAKAKSELSILKTAYYNSKRRAQKS